MFYIVLIGLLTLALLVLLVFGLHRYQLSIAQTNADKHSPLPPLDQTSLRKDLPDFSLDDEEPFSGAIDIDDDTASDNATGDEEDTEITVPVDSSIKEDRRDNNSGSPPVPRKKKKPKKKQKPESSIASNSLSVPEQEDEASDPAGEGWQEQVAELKKQDRLDEALLLCTNAFPLWSAYQQASLIHRARIKQLNQSGEDLSRELKALYTLAAKASFLHDRAKGLPNLSLAQLKALDLTPVDALDMPYDQIGYTELRLIKKTDIKLLLDLWGKPATHTKPREFHADAWKDLCGDTQSALF